MSGPSKGYIIMLFAAPIFCGILLWLVVFPLTEQSAIAEFASTNDKADLRYDAPNDDDSEMMRDFYEKGKELTPYYFSVETPDHTDRSVSDIQNEIITEQYPENENAITNPNSKEVNRNMVMADNKPTITPSKSNHELTIAINRMNTIVNNAQPIKDVGKKVEQITKEKDQSKKAKSLGGEMSLPPDDEDPVDVPLDGGLGILIAGVVGYSVKKGYNSRKKKKSHKAFI